MAAPSEHCEDLRLLGEITALVFGVDSLITNPDIEYSTRAHFQFGVDVKTFFDGGRETRSPRFVVSNTTINDANVHIVLRDRPSTRRCRSLS